MLIKINPKITDSEKAAIINTNNLYLESLAMSPVGCIVMLGGTEIPDGYLQCDGSQLDVDDYPELFRAIGYRYGGEDEVFCLPDISDNSDMIMAIKSTTAMPTAHMSELNATYANALKGSASGKVVAIKDVSPLPHNVTVKASGEAGGQETLTKTVDITEAMQTVLLDTPASSVRVVVSGGAYCVGGLVPTVSGDDLTVSGVREQLALWPTWSYGEAPGVYDVVYTVSDKTLSWSGVKYYASDSSFNEAVSGSIELSTTGQMITGFCQVYDLSEDNPYAESPEYDQLDMTVEVYEALQETKISVYGKNLFKPTSEKWFGGSAIDTFSIQEDSSIKIVGSATSFSYNLMPNPTLPAGTYTFKGTNTDKFVYYVFTLKDGVQTGWFNGTFTLDEGDTIQYLQVRNKPGITEFDDVINVQIELGSIATKYEPYIEPVTYTPNADGEISIASVYPSMTFIPDTEGVTLSVEYNRDINKAFAELQAAIISMGGNV